MKSRVRRLEQRAWGGQEPPCPECGGQMICEEILEDGTVTYPEGGPCEACGSRGSGDRIGRITADMRKPEDRPEREDAFTFELDRPIHDEESEVIEWP